MRKAMDGFQSLRGKLCCFYPTGQAWVDIPWALILHTQYVSLRSKLIVICVWCLFFHSEILQNIKHKQLDLFHFNYFKCFGGITKWSHSLVYAIVTIKGYKLKSWSRNVL